MTAKCPYLLIKPSLFHRGWVNFKPVQSSCTIILPFTIILLYLLFLVVVSVCLVTALSKQHWGHWPRGAGRLVPLLNTRSSPQGPKDAAPCTQPHWNSWNERPFCCELEKTVGEVWYFHLFVHFLIPLFYFSLSCVPWGRSGFTFFFLQPQCYGELFSLELFFMKTFEEDI